MSMNWLEATNGHADEPGRPRLPARRRPGCPAHGPRPGYASAGADVQALTILGGPDDTSGVGPGDP